MFENVLIFQSNIAPQLTGLLVICLCLLGLVTFFFARTVGNSKKAQVQGRLSSLVEEATMEDEGIQDLLIEKEGQKDALAKLPGIKIFSLFFLVVGSGLVVFASLVEMQVIGGVLILMNVAVYWALTRKEKEKQEALTLQFPEAIDLMVRGARVGVSPEGNIKVISREISAPLGPVFAQISEQLEIGLPFEAVLVEMAHETKRPEFQYLAATLSVQRKTGAQYADVLENLGVVLRQHIEIVDKTKAATSESRLAAKVIAFLVLGAVALQFFINHDQFLFLFEDPSGHSLLIYSFSSLFAGFLTINWLLGRIGK